MDSSNNELKGRFCQFKLCQATINALHFFSIAKLNLLLISLIFYNFLFIKIVDKKPKLGNYDCRFIVYAPIENVSKQLEKVKLDLGLIFLIIV